MKQRWIALVVGSTFLATACVDQTPAGSGQYPDGDIQLIVPFDAGENTDTVARAIAPCLGRRLDTTVTVRNRPGEKGVLGTREFVEADTDGHTLLLTPAGPPVVAPAVDPELGYKLEDFRFVGVPHSAPLVLFTAGNGPFDTAEKLFEAARTSATPVKVANTGASMTEELTVGELNIYEETRLESLQVDSDAELLRGVVAGDYPAGLTTISADHLARVESGEITVLASGGAIPPRYLDAPTFYRITRANMLPELPIDTTLIAPDSISDRVHATLSDALAECLNTNDVRRDIGVDFVPTELVTPGDLRARYIRLQRSVGLAQNLPIVEGR